VIKTYPMTYPNGMKAKAGFIAVDGDGSAFFHSDDFFGAGVKPQNGQRVNFGVAAGKPKERCSPVLLLQNL
jgi:cold shock CspA family protein